MQDNLKYNSGFQKPGNRRPEFGQGVSKRMCGGVWHRIRSIILETRARLFASQSIGGCILSGLCGCCHYGNVGCDHRFILNSRCHVCGGTASR
jgi:hypothetical protein